MPNWTPFPFDAAGYIYAGASLKENWNDLHLGDCEPYPDVDVVAVAASENADALPDDFDGDCEALAALIRKAWRHYHCGEFMLAVETADQCGLLGHSVANKATGVYASYLEDDEQVKQSLYQRAIERAESAMEALPGDPNAYYFHAFNLGRYSQSISIGKALKQGLAGKVLNSLKTTIQLQPRHAEAYTALGLYHAEIIDKVGKLIGSMTYGASAETALGHFQAALSITPQAPIAHIEYGNGLYMLYADKRLDEVTDAYIAASEMTARYAMEKLDIDFAHSELE